MYLHFGVLLFVRKYSCDIYNVVPRSELTIFLLFLITKIGLLFVFDYDIIQITNEIIFNLLGYCTILSVYFFRNYQTQKKNNLLVILICEGKREKMHYVTYQMYKILQQYLFICKMFILEEI